MEIQVEKFVNNIVKLHDSLKRSDLRPSELVNGLFGELVSLCTQTLSTNSTKKILEDQRVKELSSSLRQLCATAESYLESHWATNIAGLAENENEGEAFQRLREFPYFGNYIDLTRLELCAIQAINATPFRRVAFIGSGPLPLSSLCLCQASNGSLQTNGTKVLNVDNNIQAIEQSHALVTSLGPGVGGMEFLCKDAASSDLDLSGCDVVYLAALVGLTQTEKEDVLLRVVRGMGVGGLVVIRSARGLRSLLYPEFDATTEAVLKCIEICLVVHPYNQVVNSVIVGRVKPRGSSRPKF